MGIHIPQASGVDRPVCTWVPVTDAQGRIRMEARWTSLRALTRASAA